MILSFVTGADTVPPTGYSCVTLNFNNDLTASVELTLPSKHGDYETFKKHTITALTMHGEFGLM